MPPTPAMTEGEDRRQWKSLSMLRAPRGSLRHLLCLTALPDETEQREERPPPQTGQSLGPGWLLSPEAPS